MNQMLFTELKNIFLFSRYSIFKFQKYKGFYGKFELQMLISRNHENVCLMLMEHAGKVIFGQVGDLLLYFRRKVPDFLFFYFWGIHGPKSGKFGKNSQNLPKLARFWTINFTSEIHPKIPNLAIPFQHVPLALNIDFRDFEISAFEVQISHRNPYISEINKYFDQKSLSFCNNKKKVTAKIERLSWCQGLTWAALKDLLSKSALQVD